VRVSFSQIQHVEETVLMQGQVRAGGAAYWQPPQHHRCAVTTDAGTIVFSDNIADYERLKAFFVSHEPPTEAKGVFRYRSIAGFVVGACVLPITAFMCYVFFKSYLNGDQMSVNGVMEQTPLYVPLMVGAISAIFWVVVGYLILTNCCERIVVAGGRVTYYNLFGVRKVDVSLNLIERGSFEQADSLMARGGFRYWVVTPQGRIKWSDQITGCTDLVRIMQAASSSSPLGAEPGEQKPVTGNPWT
jgi:hypothetical protein